MKIKSKSFLCIALILILGVITVIVNEKIIFTKDGNNKNVNSELAYIDFNSKEFQQDFAKVLEEEYGPNYQQIVAKNVESTLTANEINEMFVSNTTNELEYPDYIGGIYINDDNKLVVQIKQNEVPSSNQSSYSSYNAVLSADDDMLTEYVSHSYNELEDIYELLNNSVSQSSVSSNVTVFYIDVIKNHVIVELLDNSVDKQNEFKEEVIDSDIIEFKQGSEPTLEAYNTGQGTYNCTIGFRAKLGSTTGFVTAGHCVSSLSIGSSYSSYGTLRAYQQGGNVDAAFIQTSTTINSTLQYPVYPVTSLSTTAGYVPNLIVGTMVGKSGKTTHGTSGKITSLSATWNGSGSSGDAGITITKMIQADYNSDHGDSGSPVFTINGGTLIGVHRGTSQGLKYSSNYNYIKTALGINIY